MLVGLLSENLSFLFLKECLQPLYSYKYEDMILKYYVMPMKAVETKTE